MADETTTPVRMRLGDYTLIDDGNGIFQPGHDDQDRIVDDQGILISERDPRIQKMLSQWGIESLRGIRIGMLNDYITAFQHGKDRLAATVDNKEAFLQAYYDITSAATFLGSYRPLTTQILKALMNTLGPNGYILPLYLAEGEALQADVTGMDAMLKIAYEEAASHGQDISARVTETQRQGYGNAIRSAHEDAKGYIRDASYDWLRHMNNALDRAVKHANTRGLYGEALFEASFVEKTVSSLEATRLEGYRKRTNEHLTSANESITGQQHNWLEHMNSALSRAEEVAREGKVYPEFTAEIIRIRRLGYKTQRDNYIKDATHEIELKHYNWLARMNEHLNRAKESVNAKVPGTDIPVFPESDQGQMTAEIEGLRKRGYREEVGTYLEDGRGLIERPPYNLLQLLDGKLAKAEAIAREGNVLDELAAQITEVRRSGYRTAITQLIGEANSHITNSNHRWLEGVNASLDKAAEYARATIQGTATTVFTNEQTGKLLAQIEGVRKTGYRKAVENHLATAVQNMETTPWHWLESMNASLLAARKVAEEGKVLAEFTSRITDTRRRGYKQEIDRLLKVAGEAIARKDWDWKDNAGRTLATAEGLTKAKTNEGTEEFVFTEGQQTEMAKAISELRKQIPT